MKLRWTRPALQDLGHLHDYIAEGDVETAAKMLTRIREAGERLRQFPHMGKAGRVSETRELILAQTPYILVYRVLGEEVQILAVIHTARRWPESFPNES